MANLAKAQETKVGPRKPNVVIFLADDQGWGDLSVQGNTNLSTPRIDSLAKEGAIFDRFFVCPVCAPTRAEFLTGRYHPRGGVFGVSTGGERLDLDEQTIADVFKGAGYATGAFGKWHNGMQYPYHPNGRGFEEYYGFCSGHWGDYFSPPLDHNGEQVHGTGFLEDDLTDHAMAFIEQNREQPFFCYLPFNTPHSPMQVPDRFYKKFAGADLKMQSRGDQGAEDIEFTRAALAMCENIDWNVGRVLDKLDELKLADDTIVIYFSDNGPNSWRWNDGMKGRKGSTDEGGVRSPLLIRWPGHIAGETKIQPIAGAIDLLPTLAELCDISYRPKNPLDGESLVSLLMQKKAEWPDRLIFSHWNGRVSVRTQRFRLDDGGKLFDMQADPGQRRNVAADHPEVAAKLKAAVADWRKELLTGFRKERPFTVGYSEFPLTVLPARDGVPHGKITRSAGAPNCSFFTNWKSTDDRITWDVEIHTAGKYEALVLYTCPASDLGCAIELRFGDSHVQTTVTETNDPPLVGAEHDRVSRKGESYVKDFKPLALGTLELPAGSAELSLRAMKIPGKGAIDVRSVLLRLVK
jgi:arylsulfatase A-like enzyme